jgi:glycolate oxidase
VSEVGQNLGFLELDSKPVGVEGPKHLLTEHDFLTMFGTCQTIFPPVQTSDGNLKRDACGLAGATLTGQDMTIRKEGHEGARSPDSIAVIEVVGARVVEVDGLLDEPQTEHANVKVNVRLGRTRDGGHVVNAGDHGLSYVYFGSFFCEHIVYVKLSDDLMDFRSLTKLFRPDQVLLGAAAERGYDCDAYTVDKSKPSAVVLPESTEEVAKLVTWCHQNQIPFTARGAGTGLSGGALPALGGVVISTKRLQNILEIDVENRCLLAQTGIANRRLSDAVKADGLHFAPDPSSQTVATLGGNIAENAGGPHTLKYGVTVQHILGVKMVMPDGEIAEFGSKFGSLGGYDFLGLICGSEGTLGIVTEAWIKLTPLPKFVQTVLASFGSVRAATESVASIIATGTIPAALEMMDRGIMNAVRAAFGLAFPDGAEALLLIECDGFSEATVQAEIDAVKAVLQHHGALEIQFAADPAERMKLWTARKKGVGAMGRIAPTVVTHDGVIPRSKLPEMLDFVYQVAQEKEIGVANIFHAGDGNLHPCFYFDDRDPLQVERVVEAGEMIIRKCIDLGGSVSGEHGIGVEKIDMMPLMFSEADLAAQGMVKRIFNDGDLCNPCKVLPNQKSCNEHRLRWRGVAT